MPIDLLHKNITECIIGSAFEVWNTSGYGFLEKVYENALFAELTLRSINVKQQYSLNVLYKGQVVGEFVADLFVDNKVIVELKAEKTYSAKHESQLLNYLTATKTSVGMLVNFGKAKVEFKRVVK